MHHSDRSRSSATIKGSSTTEVFACWSSAASLANEFWCRTATWRSRLSESKAAPFGLASPQPTEIGVYREELWHRVSRKSAEPEPVAQRA